MFTLCMLFTLFMLLLLSYDLSKLTFWNTIRVSVSVNGLDLDQAGDFLPISRGPN